MITRKISNAMAADAVPLSKKTENSRQKSGKKIIRPGRDGKGAE